jgi:hypothetical protein
MQRPVLKIPHPGLLSFDNHGHPHTAADTHGNQSGVLALSRLKHVAHN